MSRTDQAMSVALTLRRAGVALALSHALGCAPAPIADPVPGIPERHQRHVVASDFGLQWPLTADAATLACADDAVVARVNGQDHALNGVARERGYSSIDSWLRPKRALWPPTNPLKGMRQEDRQSLFAELAACEETAGASACRLALQESRGLASSELAQIEGEGRERNWPPLAPGLDSVQVLLDAGLMLCR